MVIKVVGRKRTEFVGADGKEVKGYTYYYLSDDEPNVEGYFPDKAFVSDTKVDPFILGKEYQAERNRYGKLNLGNLRSI